MSDLPRDEQTPVLSPDASCRDAALYYARTLGWRVFPVQPEDKTPYATKDVAPGVEVEKGKGGFHLASTDAATITRWWTRWPTALIGVPIEGWCIVEADVRAGGDVALARFCALHDIDLAHTVRATSASGGPHYYFRDVPGLRRAIGFLPGVDFLASGAGFVIVAPSRRKNGTYAWVPGHAPWDGAIAEMPIALREAIEQILGQDNAYAYKARPAGYGTAPRARSVTDPDAYVRAAVDHALDTVSAVKAGRRRDVLNSQSFALGRFVGGGYLSRIEARGDLVSALKHAGHALDAKAEETIDVALDEGAAQPIQLVITAKRTGAATDDEEQPRTDDEDGALVDNASVGILQQRLQAERAAHRETRRQLEGYLRLLRDPRFRPGQKVATAVAWAEAEGPPKNLYATPDDDPTDDSAPPDELQQRGYHRLYMTSAAEEKAGMNARVFGRTIDDMASVGVLKTQTRTEAVQVPLDPDITPAPTRPGVVPATAYKYMTAVYVKPGPLPQRSLSKKAVQTKALRRAADAARKALRCPSCGSQRLTAVAYRCDACKCTCTRDEAEHAGATIKTTKGGRRVNEHGEVMHHGKQHWAGEGPRQESYNATTDESSNDQDSEGGDIARNSASTGGTKDDETPSQESYNACAAAPTPEPQPQPALIPLYVSSPLITEKEGEESYNDPVSEGGSPWKEVLLPALDIPFPPEKSPRPPTPLAHPPARCPTCHGTDYWWSERWGELMCVTCWPLPLHISGRTSTHDGGAS